MNGKMLVAVAAVALGAVASGCKKQNQPVPVGSAPAEWKPALQRGDQAMGALQKSLFDKLQAAMSAGGPAAAITVCRDDAQEISAAVAQKQGIQMGRTSHKLRNPKNAPRDWVKPLLASAEGKKVQQVQPMAVDLGDRIGMVKPLGVMPLCVSCHGPKERIPADVQAVIAQAYPEDAAVGFAEGDFRGFIWAEIPK